MIWERVCSRLFRRKKEASQTDLSLLKHHV